jgi:F0F1-type ATP synthase membrane subunit b/b'
MKRLGKIALIAACLAFGCFAQEEKKGGGEAEGGDVQIWKWANFLVLAGGLGYVIGKNAPAMFKARTAQIGKDMAEAEEERKAAAARAADVDKRLANLETEIAKLRAESQNEMKAESERIAKHTADEIAKIQAHSEQEIESAGKAARMDLQRHAAELAIGLAEQKIRARMTPETQDALVGSFVSGLK